jgi:hypothetical protein
MNIKDLLQQAQNQKAIFDREEELRNLDLTPEEYMLLREDSQHIGVEILQAIAEKVGREEWIVDPQTRRLCRTSSVTARTVQNRMRIRSTISATQFSLAITSNTKRFFIKLYRDFEEFDEAILANADTLISCVQLIDDELEARVLRLEIQKKRLLEAHRNECIGLVEELNQFLAATIDSANKEINDAKELHLNAIELCKEWAKDFDNTRVLIAKSYQSLFDDEEIFHIEDSFFSEIDGVVCKLENRTGSSADLTVSLIDIYKCIPTPNLELLNQFKFKFVSLKDDYLVVEPFFKDDDFLWDILKGSHGYGVSSEIVDVIQNKETFPNGARLLSQGEKIKPYISALQSSFSKSIDDLLSFKLSPVQLDAGVPISLTGSVRRTYEYRIRRSGTVDVRNAEYKKYLQMWFSNQQEKISTLIWHIAQSKND